MRHDVVTRGAVQDDFTISVAETGRWLKVQTLHPAIEVVLGEWLLRGCAKGGAVPQKSCALISAVVGAGLVPRAALQTALAEDKVLEVPHPARPHRPTGQVADVLWVLWGFAAAPRRGTSHA